MWSLGGHFTMKAATSDTGGRFALVEAIAFRTTEPSLHIHHREDEAWRLTAPAGFESFAADLGVPATSVEPPADLILPAPDVLGPIAERYGIEVVGPPLRAHRG